MYKFKRLIQIVYCFFTETIRFDKCINFIKEVRNSFVDNAITKTSSSFIYYTLIAVVPFFALLIPILDTLGSVSVFYDMTERFFSTIVGSEYAHVLASYLVSYTKNAVSLGIVNTTVFFFSSILLINRIFVAINGIYKAPYNGKHENLVKRFFSYMVFLVIFIIFLSIFVFSINSFITALDKELEFISLSWINRLIGSRIFKLVAIFFTLYGMICLIPKVYVSSKYAIIGALFSETGIVILTLLLRLFVNVIFRKSSIIYGSVASVLVFLFWLYWVWTIFLLGVNISYVAQYHPEKNSERIASVSDIIANMANFICLIATSFKSASGGVKLSTAAQVLRLPSYEVIYIADQFVSAGLIYPVGKLKNRIYCLSLPPEKISVYFILDIIIGKNEKSEYGAELVESIKEQLSHNFSKVTLNDIIG